MDDDKLKDLVDLEDFEDDDDEEMDEAELAKMMESLYDPEDDDEDEDDVDKSAGESDGNEQEEDEDKEEPELPDDIDSIVNQRVAEELNRIIPERLKRDRKTQQVANLEQIAGMPLEQITQQVVQNMIEAKADELGISEEESRSIVNTQIENAGIKAQRANEQSENQDITNAMQQVKYLQDKNEWAKKPKQSRVLTKEIVAEIDAFTQNGRVLSFEDGMKYVLGEKLASGELIQNVQAGAEKKAQKNIQQRGKASPQNRKSGSTKPDDLAGAITRQQMKLASAFGLTDKEDLKTVAKEIQNERKRKQRRSR